MGQVEHVRPSTCTSTSTPTSTLVENANEDQDEFPGTVSGTF